MRKKILSKIGSVLLIIIMALCATVIVYTTLKDNKPSVFGYRMFVVRSGSMHPFLEVGDLIITKKADREDLQVGDVITFISTDSTINSIINTHRIIKIEGSLFYTMGDNNPKADETPVKYSNILGELAWSSSSAGAVLRWFASPAVMAAIVSLPVLLIIFRQLKNKNFKLKPFILKDKKEKSGGEDEPSLKGLLKEKPGSLLPADLYDRIERVAEHSGGMLNREMSERAAALIFRGQQITRLGIDKDENGAFLEGRSNNLGGFQMADVSFGSQIRGYNTKEVDEYIEKVHKEYTEVCAFLQEKIKTLETSLSSQEDVANAMIRAESVSRVIEDEGRAKAAQIINEAEVKAQSIISMAEMEAGRFVRDAKESREKIRNEMQQIYNIADLFLKQIKSFDEDQARGGSPDNGAF